MTSEIRQQVFQMMSKYSKSLILKNKKVLEVGIAGDPKPGGNYEYFGIGNRYYTLDKVAKYEPHFVQDICKTDFKDGEWDLVICSQTLEHIYDFHAAVKEIARITKGHAIIDAPWQYPYHAEEPDFQDYWRFSKDAFEKLLEPHFRDVDLSMSDLLTSALCTK